MRPDYLTTVVSPFFGGGGRGHAVFSEIFFLPLPFFSLYEEHVVRFSLLDVVFLPCDHGLDF